MEAGDVGAESGVKKIAVALEKKTGGFLCRPKEKVSPACRVCGVALACMVQGLWKGGLSRLHHVGMSCYVLRPYHAPAFLRRRNR